MDFFILVFVHPPPKIVLVGNHSLEQGIKAIGM